MTYRKLPNPLRKNFDYDEYNKMMNFRKSSGEKKIYTVDILPYHPTEKLHLETTGVSQLDAISNVVSRLLSDGKIIRYRERDSSTLHSYEGNDSIAPLVSLMKEDLARGVNWRLQVTSREIPKSPDKSEQLSLFGMAYRKLSRTKDDFSLSRNEVKKIINETSNDEVKDEIRHFMEVEHEDPYDEVDAFIDIENMTDCGRYSRNFINNLHEIEFKLGMIEETIPSLTVTTRGVSFVWRNKRWDYVKSLYDIQESKFNNSKLAKPIGEAEILLDIPIDASEHAMIRLIRPGHMEIDEAEVVNAVQKAAHQILESFLKKGKQEFLIKDTKQDFLNVVLAVAPGNPIQFRIITIMKKPDFVPKSGTELIIL